MEENARRNQKGLIIFSIIYFIIICSLLGFYFYKQSIIKNEQNVNDKYQKELQTLKNELEDIENTGKQLSQEITDIKNIDEGIIKAKEEVFLLASQLEKKIQEGNSEYKIAYLTFDDGPYALTNSYLDILNRYRIKATFFTIGLDKDRCFDNRNQDCSVMYKKIVDNGHTIANHTYSHRIFAGLYSNVDSFMYQVNLQEELIKNRTGVITNIVRFPGGSDTAKGLKDGIIARLREKNYGWVDWTAQNGDGGAIANTNKAWENFVSSIDQNIEVVLFHDYSYTTLALLPQAIEYLQNSNYILLPLFYDSVMINK